jgi:hypothetical protein
MKKPLAGFVVGALVRKAVVRETLIVQPGATMSP